MSQLEFRPALPTDTPRILETLKLALGETPVLRRTPELWSWKHTQNPFGPSIVLVATDGETIAGVRALMRWELQSIRTVVRCVRAVDTATHPDYRRRGIFRRLTDEAVALARSDGVHMIFNTPNEKSSSGYLSMGWQHVGWIGVQVRPTLSRPVPIDKHLPPTMSSLAPEVPAIESMPDEIEEREPRGLRTERSLAYRRWRFAGHPAASYGWMPNDGTSGLVARASVRSGRGEVVVSDLLGSPGGSVVTAVARHSRTRYIAGWFSPTSPERSTAIRAGLLPIPGIRTLRLVARPLVELDTNPLDLDSWDIATSDLELL